VAKGPAQERARESLQKKPNLTTDNTDEIWRSGDPVIGTRETAI
jgi:hypothetical protein